MKHILWAAVFCDMMLGLNPKDFDAVTNATQSSGERSFWAALPNYWRRFELAHVYSGRELIEVATFRAPPKAVTSASGMILRDNNWGTIEQDFKCAVIFPSIPCITSHVKASKFGFCHAVDDIKTRTLRFLGEPAQRFEEDPVRMLRALRFAIKLNFQIDQSILDVLVLR